MIRGLGYLRSLADLETVPSPPRTARRCWSATWAALRSDRISGEGVAEWNGDGETVGGIVVMRYGMNALNVIDGVKKKLAEIAGSLPPGVEIVSGYDRSGLIQASINTLKRDLLEEAIIVSLVIIIFLFHFRSALIPILALPIAVIASFIPMYYLHVSSNIMSLGRPGAGDRRAGRRCDRDGRERLSASVRGAASMADHEMSRRERRRILLDAAKQVGPAIFFSLMIIVVSFLPVFLLEAQEGRMFRPLAWTKTLAIAFSSILAITLVPVLMVIFIRGRLRPESRNPVSRFIQAIYLPILIACLRSRKLTIARQPGISGGHPPAGTEVRQPVHAAAVRRIHPLHADRVCRASRSRKPRS